MYYKIFKIFLLMSLLTNCTIDNLKNNQVNLTFDKTYRNKGFALIYDKKLYDKKILSRELDERSLIIFQRNLKKGTQVKITNILNNKSLLVNVGYKANYPLFNNTVISSRIAKELNINIEEPYVEIISISNNSLFIANRAKTYEEEKKVANKVPVNSISINDLNVKKKVPKEVSKKKFSYLIKVADFYFKDSGSMMIDRIKTQTVSVNPKIKKISSNLYRVYLGPFDNINSLQNSYNDIDILGFENIEIIKND
tara:strand:- start:1715 stop:2473 length:759 start_codon:yes stop_codon:yes gene_type:complete